jgi:YVTN family beta-propeller protein
MTRTPWGTATASAVLALISSCPLSAQPASTAQGAAPSAPLYRLTKSVPLGMPDRWDYVVFDAPSHRVYVAHGDRVTVVDGHDGQVLGQVEGFPGGTHGIAIASAAGRGYTDDGRAGEAGAFDLSTLKVLKRIKAEDDADAMAFDPSSGHVFVVNGDPGSLTVIDPKADRAVATVAVGAKLEYVVSGGNGKLYVNGAEKREIVRVDTASNEVDARWPIPNCESPHGLAIDPASHRLFSSCVNKVLVVVDTDSGHTVATLPIGSGTDAAAFDPKRRRVFSSNGRDGTLSVIQEKDAQTFVPLGELKTAATARTMSLDPDTGRLYLVAADIDPTAPPLTGPPPPGAARPPGAPPPRMPIIPGSLRLLFFDPVP